jgi:hypothetical protein
MSPNSLKALSLLFDNANEMADLVDHAAHFRRILKRAAAMQLIQPETDQRSALAVRAAVRAGDLLDRHRFAMEVNL